MDREQIAAHLAEAERHIKQGEDHIERQFEVIARLESAGLDTTEAKRLLAEFEKLLAIDIATRDRVREELVRASKKRTDR